MSTVQLEQKMSALAKANEVRSANCVLKREIQALGPVDGRRLVASILVEPSGAVLALPVGALLLSVRRVGDTQVLRLLSAVGVRSVDRRVRDLSFRQRRDLAGLLVGVGERE